MKNTAPKSTKIPADALRGLDRLVDTVCRAVPVLRRPIRRRPVAKSA